MTKQCCQVKYNFVLMDIRMPVMDGFKSAEKILSFHTDMKNTRGLRSLVQDLHIFAISSYVNTDTVQKAKEVGFLKIF